MVTDGISDHGTLDRIDLEPSDPTPADCIPPDVTPISVSEHPSGWIAVTHRNLFVYRSERDPAVVRLARPNVTGLAVRRAGLQSFLRYVPMALLYACFGIIVGILLLTVSPDALITLPETPGVGGGEMILQTLQWTVQLLGVVLAFSGILAGLAGTTIITYWFVSGDVAFSIERGAADEIECAMNRQAGQRILRELEDVLSK